MTAEKPEARQLRNILKFTITGVVIGFLMGGVLSLPSGNWFVVFFIGSIVTVVGLVLGIVHRNDP